MGARTQELTSCALNSTYPAFYKEFQVRNWTGTDLVLTDADGSQHVLTKMSEPINDQNAAVEIELRKHNGSRSELTKFGMKDVPIATKKVSIPLTEIRLSPYRVEEYGIILSTVDHALVARNMLRDNLGNPIVYETTVDNDITDPRLVFQVIDPNCIRSVLFVNVFGQTMILRAGHYADPLPMGIPDDAAKTDDKGTLTCYMRYPNGYYKHARAVNTVFEIPLDDVEKEEPYVLPSGDVICMADTIEGLQRVLEKKHAGISRQFRIQSNNNMVSKELFESAKTAHKEEVERLKKEAAVKLETVTLEKDNEIAKLKASVQDLTQQVNSLKAQVATWENLSKVQSAHRQAQSEDSEARAKAEKAWYDVYVKQQDSTWNAIKIGCSTALSIATLVLAFQKKRK